MPRERRIYRGFRRALMHAWMRLSNSIKHSDSKWTGLPEQKIFTPDQTATLITLQAVITAEIDNVAT